MGKDIQTSIKLLHRSIEFLLGEVAAKGEGERREFLGIKRARLILIKLFKNFLGTTYEEREEERTTSKGDQDFRARPHTTILLTTSSDLCNALRLEGVVGERQLTLREGLVQLREQLDGVVGGHREDKNRKFRRLCFLIQQRDGGAQGGVLGRSRRRQDLCVSLAPSFPIIALSHCLIFAALLITFTVH